MDYIKVGMIIKPHGIKGEMKILPLTDDIDRFHDLKNIYILNKDNYSKEEIVSVKNMNEHLILKLKSYNRIEEAELVRNKYLFVDRADAVNLSEDEYYTQDLIGCEFWFEDKKFGKVLDLLNEGSCDIFVVDHDGKDVFYPFLKELISKVDIINKKIIIKEIKGYFD
jgi:16S rRNA processing protein RimM